jgi:alkylhydroperoxidase/carboxymuconolactone decarboxylase family protein YurZ
MNKTFAAILSGIFLSVLGLAAISEAQTMKSEDLSARQTAIVPIAAFTAKGDLERLKTALSEGLDAGLAISEIKEVLVQLYAYTGFPRSLNALGAFMGVVEERLKKGIKDEQGREPSPLPTGKTRLELGTQIQTQLVGAPVSGPLYTFAPAIDVFLKEHLFGDIFGRDNLDFKNREIATIAALASMEGVNPQLRAHFNVGMNVGLSEAPLRRLASVIAAKVGTKEGDNASDVLNGVLKSRAS